MNVAKSNMITYWNNAQDEKARFNSTWESQQEKFEETVYVHVVPHSHDDVGWVWTIDEYYSGTQNNEGLSVKQTINAIIEALLLDPKRKFTYVEMKYFQMWYSR